VDIDFGYMQRICLEGLIWCFALEGPLSSFMVVFGTNIANVLTGMFQSPTARIGLKSSGVTRSVTKG
jgi:hypothetical protein